MRLRLFFLLAVICWASTLAGVTASVPMSRDSVMSLADPLSPRHDEEALVEALRLVLDNPQASRADRGWCEVMLEMALKNRVGDKCADLDFVIADGATANIHGIEAPMTLIFFNDPDCLSCHQVKERLDTCATLREMVARDELVVLALCVGDDEHKWRVEGYPDYVINAFDASRAVDEGEVYDLPTMPLFYLLDEEKRVLLKNEPSLNRVLRVLATGSR